MQLAKTLGCGPKTGPANVAGASCGVCAAQQTDKTTRGDEPYTGCGNGEDCEVEEPGLLRETLSCVTHHGGNNAVKANARLTR